MNALNIIFIVNTKDLLLFLQTKLCCITNITKNTQKTSNTNSEKKKNYIIKYKKLEQIFQNCLRLVRFNKEKITFRKIINSIY